MPFMKALFDKNCNFVGWFCLEDGNLFDRNMNWIGFKNENNLFSNQAKWLGGFVQGSILDKMGRPVAWMSGSIPHGRLRLLQPLRPLQPLNPLRPLQPLNPLRPLRPLPPLGGWSNYTWHEFMGQ